MFDQLLRELKKIEHGILAPVEMPVDEDGYFDRECPAEPCRAAFKVLFTDWKEKVRDEQVFCPICRYEAKATEWNTPEQAEHIRAIALAHVHKIVTQALTHDSEHFNRVQPRGGFVSLTLSYRPGQLPVLVTPSAADLMRQSHSCEGCGCRYASIGAAFFCPSCGKGSAQKTFEGDVETATKIVRNLPILRDALRATGDNDAAQDTSRVILENTQGSLVGIFQHYAEALYSDLNGVPKARKNVFQNVIESSRLWKEAFGYRFEDLMTAEELSDISRFFQQRHLIAHKGGIVDAEYVTKSADGAYATGQRIVVTEDSVLRLAELVLDLGRKLRGLRTRPGSADEENPETS